MSSSLSIMKLNLSSNPLMMEEEVSQINENKKQGIVSILGSSTSDSPKSIKAASLRRTLSADMSSKSWLSQNGFSSLKKIASSDEFPISEEEDEAAKIWASIQRDKTAAHEAGKQVDLWNSILLSTNNNDKQAEDGKDQPSSAPYVHPLVKRSKSSLSQRSLQICTESLGSETGSEGFSSDSPSSDEEENNKEDRRGSMMVQSFEEQVPIIANKYSVSSYYCDKKSSPLRSFPPPIPSLSPSLRMQSHRENGRLVLEAVSVPTKLNFHAQRQDGRLVLTFVKKDEQALVQEEKKDVIDEVVEVDQEQEVGGAKMEEQVEQGPKFVESGVMNIPNRGAIMANKFMRLSNRNSPWAKKFNEKVELDAKEAELAESKTLLPQSLQPPPRVSRRIPPIPAPPSAATAASFNAYEYCWRRKASAASVMPTSLPGKNQTPPPSPKNNLNNNMFALSSYANCKTAPEKTRSGDDCKLKNNRADYLVPLTRNCMEPRRPLSFWETYCISTST